MINTQDYAITGSGAAVGLTAGYLLGKSKADAMLAKIKPEILNAVKNTPKDVYVGSRIEANIGNIASLGRKHKLKALSKIREKAIQDYDNVAKIIKDAPALKNKWIAGLAVVGLALGAILASMFHKDKN